MELDAKGSSGWKRRAITLGIVIITAAVVGGSVYLVMNKQAQKDRAAAESNAESLQAEIDNLKSAQEASARAAQATKDDADDNDSIADWETYSDQTHNFSFKYPKGLIVAPVKSSDAAGSYSVYLDKSENVKADGSYAADVSDASLKVSAAPSSDDASSSQVTINTPSGDITASYTTGTAPEGYTYYTYEFQKDGKYYLFRMDNYDDQEQGKTVLMTAGQFKQLVDTITFR